MMAEISPNLYSEWRTVPLVAWKINMGDRQATLSNGSRMDGQKSKTNDDGGTDALAVQCEREEEASNDCDTFIERKGRPPSPRRGKEDDARSETLLLQRSFLVPFPKRMMMGESEKPQRSGL